MSTANDAIRAYAFEKGIRAECIWIDACHWKERPITATPDQAYAHIRSELMALGMNAAASDINTGTIGDYAIFVAMRLLSGAGFNMATSDPEYKARYQRVAAIVALFFKGDRSAFIRRAAESI